MREPEPEIINESGFEDEDRFDRDDIDETGLKEVFQNESMTM